MIDKGVMMKTHSKMKSKKAAASKAPLNNNSPTDIGRGEIKDNFLAALVTSKAYRVQVVTAKKGKGSFKRKDKYQAKNIRQESYLIAA